MLNLILQAENDSDAAIQQAKTDAQALIEKAEKKAQATLADAKKAAAEKADELLKKTQSLCVVAIKDAEDKAQSDCRHLRSVADANRRTVIVDAAELLLK